MEAYTHLFRLTPCVLYMTKSISDNKTWYHVGENI